MVPAHQKLSNYNFVGEDEYRWLHHTTETLPKAGPKHNRCRGELILEGSSRGVTQGQLGVHLRGGEREETNGQLCFTSWHFAYVIFFITPSHSLVRWIRINIPILLIGRLRPKRKMNSLVSPREQLTQLGLNFGLYGFKFFLVGRGRKRGRTANSLMRGGEGEKGDSGH